MSKIEEAYALLKEIRPLIAFYTGQMTASTRGRGSIPWLDKLEAVDNELENDCEYVYEADDGNEIYVKGSLHAIDALNLIDEFLDNV